MGISPDFGSVTHQFQMELGFIVSSFKLSNLTEQGEKKKKRSSNWLLYNVLCEIH